MQPGDISARGRPVIFGPRIRLGYVKLSLADGAVHPLPDCPANSFGLKPELTVVKVRCATNGNGGIAWRDDGADPSATDGMPVEHGLEETFNGDPTTVKVVRLTADAVVVHVSYYY